jgi:GNAT superfamily N-acetyltransferase
MAMIARRRGFAGRAERADVMVRQLGPRSEADVLDLLGSAGGTSRPNQFIHAAGQIALPPAAWTAGLFVASELRGVVRAGDASPEGQVEATLFVDERWRRRGLGSMLLEQAMDWARRGDANILRFVCERTDWPMRHFARKFGARLDLVLGQIVVDIPVARVPL